MRHSRVAHRYLPIVKASPPVRSLGTIRLGEWSKPPVDPAVDDRMPRQRTTGPSFTRCRAPSRCPEFLGSLCSEPAAHDGQLKRPQNPRRTDRATTRGLTVSQSCCTLVGNRKHRRSVSGTDRTGAGIMLSKPTLSGREERGRSRGGGGWGRARRQGSDPVVFAFSVAPGLPGGMDGSFRVSGTASRIRTLGAERSTCGCRSTLKCLVSRRQALSNRHCSAFS